MQLQAEGQTGEIRNLPGSPPPKKNQHIFRSRDTLTSRSHLAGRCPPQGSLSTAQFWKQARRPPPASVCQSVPLSEQPGYLLCLQEPSGGCVGLSLKAESGRDAGFPSECRLCYVPADRGTCGRGPDSCPIPGVSGDRPEGSAGAGLLSLALPGEPVISGVPRCSHLG